VETQQNLFDIGIKSDTGKVRKVNQDNCFSRWNFPLPGQGVWIVADGMGGHESGGLASDMVISLVPEALKRGMSLEQAIELAHQKILAAAQSEHQSRPMGSTVVVAHCIGAKYHIAWVGDSRAYVFSEKGIFNEKAGLQRLSHDHSFVQQLLDVGAINEEEARVHPQRNVITQSLGGSTNGTIRVDSLDGELQNGQWLLLCSDGLTNELDDKNIDELLNSALSAQVVAEQLVARANEHGGRDNVTVILLKYLGEHAREGEGEGEGGKR